MITAWGLLLLASQAVAMGPIGAPTTSAEEYDSTGRMLLEAGRYRAASAHYGAVVRKAPSPPGWARAGLAEALVGVGRCHAAEPHLDDVYPTDAWSPGTATAAGLCAARVGMHADAIAYFQEAIAMDPEFVRAWYQMARSAAATGDVPLYEEALEALDGHSDAPYAKHIAQLWVAFERGGDVEMEVDLLRRRLAKGPERGAAAAQLAIVDARLWMRAGGPELAMGVLEEAAEGRWDDARLLAWLGEAGRRVGHAELAESILDGPLVSRSHTAEVRLLRARWLVDRGRVDEAVELLDLTEGQERPLWYATRWYLAQARGEALEPWARRYAVEAGPHAELLAHLTPRRR